MLYEITYFRDVRKDDVIVRYVAGKPTSIGRVFMIQRPPHSSTITLITDTGHRVVGKPDQILMRGTK